MMKFASLNVRTLSGLWRKGELTNEAHNFGLSFVGIQEHRQRIVPEKKDKKKPSGQISTKRFGNGWNFVYASAEDDGTGGVGGLLSPKAYAALTATTFISKRILSFQFSTTGRRWPEIIVFVCYSPTSDSSTEKIELFY